jgi:hypothetical protein
MYFLYLDDSGSVPNPNEHHFVLGGVCVHESKVYYLRKYLDDLAEEFSPGSPGSLEFHASEIHAGQGLWKGIKNRKEIIKRVLKSLETQWSKTAAFACAVHKADFPGQDPVEFAFEDICSRFQLFLDRVYHETKTREKGILILDKSIYENILQKLAITFRQGGTRWRIPRDLIEVPMFLDSKSSRLIQLADHVAYATFRRYQAADLTYFNIIEGSYDSHEDIIHGLSHKQHSMPKCTCPACLRR